MKVLVVRISSVFSPKGKNFLFEKQCLLESLILKYNSTSLFEILEVLQKGKSAK